MLMVGQSKLMPGQLPGCARVWLRLCVILLSSDHLLYKKLKFYRYGV